MTVSRGRCRQAGIAPSHEERVCDVESKCIKAAVANSSVFLPRSSRRRDDACRRDRRPRRRRVPQIQGELVSRYLTAAAAIKRGLRSRGGLPMARLLPTTCHPGSRDGCAARFAAAAPLRYAKQTGGSSPPSAIPAKNRPLRDEREVPARFVRFSQLVLSIRSGVARYSRQRRRDVYRCIASRATQDAPTADISRARRFYARSGETSPIFSVINRKRPSHGFFDVKQ
jgi:hypothetical protein